MNKGKRFLKIFAVGVLCLLLLGAIIMLLWNWLVPQLFNGPQIGFLDALGLFLLAKILFGGWGGGKWRDRGAGWKSRYYDKLSTMSPEERERFKKRMSEKWCYDGSKKESPQHTSND